jgi:hypothetical protein
MDITIFLIRIYILCVKEEILCGHFFHYSNTIMKTWAKEYLSNLHSTLYEALIILFEG